MTTHTDPQQIADTVRRELRWRAERGDILCLNEHVAYFGHADVWLCCGAKEVGRYTPPIGKASDAQEWLHRMMDRHRLEVAERLVRELLIDGDR